EEVGDEPWMMHHALKDVEVPIFVSPDRVRSGQAAIRHYHSQVLLLDDGFQHLRLRRDVDIVLLNALDPFGGGHLLPLGNLRESAHGLRRAHLAVITHADRVSEAELARLRETIAQLAPRLPVAEAAHRPDHLLDLKKEERHPLERLRGTEVVTVCGLGEPQAFEEGVRGLGAALAQRWRYPDHHPYDEAELRSIENVRRGMPLVTTFKDAARFPAGWRAILGGEVLALSVRMELTRGRELWEAALRGERVPA
ncbi:MAG TPA: tetraacyldisaccharide 4'-kinase, partial [Elusimicrobiota bacterium]|nr:tetraacyldisaccharide 4'-kinase [Elusimicrobiota bacterium]